MGQLGNFPSSFEETRLKMYISNYTPTCHSSPLSVTPTTGTDRTSKPAKARRTAWLHDIEGVNKSGCQLESGQIMNFQNPELFSHFEVDSLAVYHHLGVTNGRFGREFFPS